MLNTFEHPRISAGSEGERRDRTPLGELRRRLYIAERHGFVKLAAMWRKQIGDLDQKDFEAHQEGKQDGDEH